ncbi:hypothetical protein [Deinococcus ruber]|uniref:Uncharacterized protein n=1 Tax=Deinococcus ruber TaxID=1848197 RepID=A0A918CLY1_9DEIO|nr:hypothetical protein [Deinococcus ruber]GGR31372.1 hypothetical protein GCM10008957_47590 [Deinococcus ruber]
MTSFQRYVTLVMADGARYTVDSVDGVFTRTLTQALTEFDPSRKGTDYLEMPVGSGGAWLLVRHITTVLFSAEKPE